MVAIFSSLLVYETGKPDDATAVSSTDSSSILKFKFWFQAIVWLNIGVDMFIVWLTSDAGRYKWFPACDAIMIDVPAPTTNNVSLLICATLSLLLL